MFAVNTDARSRFKTLFIANESGLLEDEVADY